MQAIEATGMIDEQGTLTLDQPLALPKSRVRVIVLVETADEIEEGFSAPSFQRSWEQAVTGQTLPLSQL